MASSSRQQSASPGAPPEVEMELFEATSLLHDPERGIRHQSTSPANGEGFNDVSFGFIKGPLKRTTDFTNAVKQNTNRKLQRSRFYGWRMGVLVGSCSALLALCCNIGLLIAGYRSGYKDGIADLIEDNEDSIERWNTAFHVLINFLSTILLAGSNYTMQVISSPTRAEIDRAHAKGEWLDIGILSPRNLRFISRKRATLCVALAISSIPLHLFYNACIFKILAVREYQIHVADVQTDDYEHMFFNDSTRRFPSREYTPMFNLSNSDWRKSYKSRHVSQYSDLYLAVDQIAYNTRQNAGEFSVSDLLSGSFPLDITASDLSFDSQSQDRVPYKLTNLSAVDSNAQNFTAPASLHVVNAYTSLAGIPSRVQLSFHFTLIVIVANVLKFLIMIYVLLADRSEYIVTLGDAAASFLENPDQTTRGNCLLKNDTLLLERRSPPAFASLGNGDEPGTTSSLNSAWRPRLQYYDASVGTDKGIPAVLSPMFLGIILFLVPTLWSDYSNPWAWGTASDNVVFSNPTTMTKSSATGTLFNAWLANMPQVLLSFCYINLNTMCTSMSAAQEWNGFGRARKGLRVTKPTGEQRSTHFLQLPYRWSVPLMATSGILHWLLSQTFFLVRFDAFDRAGNLKAEESTSACGSSFSSLVALFIVALGLAIGVGWVGHRTMLPSIPPVNNCSMFISASCHPPSDESDPHLGRVKWGVVDQGSDGGHGHCSLSSRGVKEPEVGVVYL